jgi:anti-sigma factor ChrR (cupin superfamily)
MSKYDADILAAEYVLGVLSAEQCRRFEERMEKEPALRRQVARWEVLLTRLEAGNRAAPPAALSSRIGQALDQETLAASFYTVRLEDGDWVSIRSGLEKKLLYRDPVTGEESYLFRMQPGASIEGHRHAKAEECLILEGDLAIGDLRLNAGDYHVAAKGTIHPVLRSQRGALMFVRGGLI